MILDGEEILNLSNEDIRNEIYENNNLNYVPVKA